MAGSRLAPRPSTVQRVRRDRPDDVADQGGLWKASPELIGFLAVSTDDLVILVDNFENPVLVNRIALHEVLYKTYNDAMQLWFSEWKELESKR